MWASLDYSQSLLDLRSSTSMDLETRDEGESAAISSFKSLRCYYNESFFINVFSVGYLDCLLSSLDLRFY